jgi:hypothetical protein
MPRLENLSVTCEKGANLTLEKIIENGRVQFTCMCGLVLNLEFDNDGNVIDSRKKVVLTKEQLDSGVGMTIECFGANTNEKGTGKVVEDEVVV